MTGWRGSLRRMTGLLALASATWVLGGGQAGAAALSPRPVDPRSWTVYHHDAAGTGVAAPVAAVDTATRAWTSPTLDGKIYGEPLVSSGRGYLAAENHTGDALSSPTRAGGSSSHV